LLLLGNPSQRYGASLAIWDHTVLPATRHKWMHPATAPANQAGSRFTYPGRMEGWVDLGSLIAVRIGIEPTTAWSQVHALTVVPLSRPIIGTMKHNAQEGVTGFGCDLDYVAYIRDTASVWDAALLEVLWYSFKAIRTCKVKLKQNAETTVKCFGIVSGSLA